MTRNELIHQTLYSYYLERMHATLFGRIDRFLSACIFILGASVFAAFKGTLIYGALIAVISAISFIYQFGKASANADSKSRKYLHLSRIADSLDDSQFKDEFLKLEEADSKAWHSLELSAQQRATMSLGWQDDVAIVLTPFQKAISWLAGGLPNQVDYLNNNVNRPAG